MNQPFEIGKAKDKNLGVSMAAMQTDRAIVVVKNKKLVRVTAEQLRKKDEA